MKNIAIVLLVCFVIAGGVWVNSLVKNVHTGYANAAISDRIGQRETTVKSLHDYIKARRSNMPDKFAGIIAESIVSVSERENVPVSLIAGIIETESIWNPMAVSSAGAMGLMQILRGETVEVDPDQAHNIEYNISTGVAILKGKVDLNDGNLLMALNNYSGNRNGYADDVMRNMGRYLLWSGR